MRKINIFVIIACILSILSIQSCSDFLNLKPKNVKVVSTIEDYRDIMGGYMKLLTSPIRTEQIKTFGESNVRPKFDVHETIAIYTGEADLTRESDVYFNKSTGEATTGGKKLLNWTETEHYIWEDYYRFLGPINLIINGIEDAKGKNENMRNYVKGEALVWRAYSYFKLLQYFAPYDNDKYGVPVYLQPYKDLGKAMPPRETQTKVYEQILSDCYAVMDLLDISSSNDWNCAYNRDFVNAMMASIYTYKAMSAAAAPDDWSQAEKHATMAILNRKLATDTEQIKELFNCATSTIANHVESEEYFLRIADGSDFILRFEYGYYGKGLGDGKIARDYYALFSDNDIRKEAYFNTTDFKNDKYNLLNGESNSGGVIMPFRLAEMFLIKAEAFCRMNKTQEALQALKPFITSRYTTPPTVGTNQKEVLDFVLDERKREFYMENDFRWLDMKRLGVTIKRNISGEKYTLLPNDFRYCFPIPRQEMERNKNMVQTPGWENILL